MNRTLLLKFGTIGLLMLLLMIPVQLIDGIIDERQSHRDTALDDIARSSSYEQQITGPLLVVPYRKTERHTRVNNSVRFQEEREAKGALYFLPDSFSYQGNMKIDLRKRGIYQARVYHARGILSGQFNVPADWGIEKNLGDYQFETPYLAVGIRDIRGIENSPALQIINKTTEKAHENKSERTLPFKPGTKVVFLGDGIHAPLDISEDGQALIFDFRFGLNLQGTSQLDFVPVGRESSVELQSDWPHPSFVGNYLPSQRTITADGFDAIWETSFFSTNLHDVLGQCVADDQCEAFQQRRLGVNLLDPVDQYLKSDRALKYALLFIGLTFAGFFLTEVLKQLSIHPVQYGLVGLSLAIFYLLLLSLAEQIGFALAYLLSSSACILLNSFYVGNVLQSRLRGGLFGFGLTALYGLLYGLLGAEDYALLMGSIMVFGLLGLFMMLTRNLDWFSIGRSLENSADKNVESYSRLREQ